MVDKPKNRAGSGRKIEVGREQSQYDHHVLDVARVVRVVKGGRRFRFRASVVVGDHNGKVGFGVGKSRDVQSAIQKAQAQAEKNVISLQLHEGTVPHEVFAKFKGARVKLRPARPGTGVIAGDVIRTVADMAGVRDLVSKTYGSANKMTNVLATLKAFQMVQPSAVKQKKD